MLNQTRGIVFRTVKYGETSIIASVYTEKWGLQSYLINGVRTYTRKGPGKANLLQPGALLELVVYHNEMKQLQRIKEMKWGVVYNQLFSDVTTHAVALFMIELLQKTIREPEPNSDLFGFIEDALLHLDQSSKTVTANFPLYFSLHLATFCGIQIRDNYNPSFHILDLQEGVFVGEMPSHPAYVGEPLSAYTAQLLKTMHPSELAQLPLNRDTRRKLLSAYETFFALHLQDFGTLKTLPVLQEVLE